MEFTMTFAERGYYIVDKELLGRFPIKVTHPDIFTFGRPIRFQTTEEANEFLQMEYISFEEINILLRDIVRKSDADGEYAIYKLGGFSADMTDANLHPVRGWHLFNLSNEADAKMYTIFQNYRLSILNAGLGQIHYAVKDSLSINHK